MRVVLDTNVFISGVFFGGPPHQILKAWRDGEVQLVVSAQILDEYQRVGHTLGEQFPDVDIGPILVGRGSSLPLTLANEPTYPLDPLMRLAKTSRRTGANP
jgi:hypothetical protein